MSNIDKLLEKYKNIEGERFFAELYNKEEYKVTREVYDVVLDIGACAGEFSAYIYDWSKTIYAIEPHSGHYKELEDNIKEFELSKIKPFKLALSNQNGVGKLVLGDRGSHKLGIAGEEIETKTLATFIKDNNIEHIDLLKIDIENGENDVFNSEDFKEIVDRIDFIIGEHLDGVRILLEGYGFKYSRDRANLIFKR